MIFDLTNYWIFLAAISVVYIAVLNVVQNNIGGKGKLPRLQGEIKEIQKRMTEAAKKKDNVALDAAIADNWKATMELMAVQAQLFVVLIMILFGLMFVFPVFEPGTQDDVRLALFDDGLSSHCDASAGDGNFSNCYPIPPSAQRGAWVIDAYLYSSANESMSRNATAVYVEGGNHSDVWLQTQAQGGILDSLTGKVPHYVSVSAGKANYTAGETVEISAKAFPSVPQGARMDAVIDSGTFFYVDLPFALPLINISRIIGSYGVFIFYVFVLSMVYSLAKAVYAAAKKVKQ